MTKILVIEDDPIVRDNLKDILELECFEVQLADNGQLGIEAATASSFDLIICDIMMPGADGYEVVKNLRQNSKTERVPFIFLTAKVDRQDQRIGMDLGADDYLTKPFVPREVLSAIRSRLERHAAFQLAYQKAQQQATAYQKQAQDTQTIVRMKSGLLEKISEDLRESLTNVNLALYMLSQASCDDERDRYMRVLKQEYAREMNLLKEVANLQSLIAPENLKLLKQFNWLQ
ncbi:MAG: response regulator transcription factor [Almyronema sp.]